MRARQYDHMIVDAGSVSCVPANRLTENKRNLQGTENAQQGAAL